MAQHGPHVSRALTFNTSRELGQREKKKPVITFPITFHVTKCKEVRNKG